MFRRRRETEKLAAIAETKKSSPLFARLMAEIKRAFERDDPVVATERAPKCLARGIPDRDDGIVERVRLLVPPVPRASNQIQ